MTAPDTIVWISGATEGLGIGLAHTVPYPNARIINLSRRQHPEYETVQFDLTKPDTWDAIGEHFTSVLADFTGTRAIFIHNAFYRGHAGFVSEMDQQTYKDEIIANAMAPQLLGDMFLRAVGPGYESGLVLMSSAGARSPFEGHSSYCAAKAGVASFTRCTALEYGPIGVRCNSIAPGIIQTDMTKPALSSAETMADWMRRIPLKKLGQPEDVAEVVAWLVSDESRYVTGDMIFIDGGWVLE